MSIIIHSEQFIKNNFGLGWFSLLMVWVGRNKKTKTKNYSFWLRIRQKTKLTKTEHTPSVNQSKRL